MRVLDRVRLSRARFVLFICVVSASPALADVQTAWVARYNAPGNDYEKGYDIAVDAVGNVYVTGMGSWGGANEEDYLTLKYDAFGNLLWAASYDGPDHLWDEASALALDGQGNVIVTGLSWGSSSGYDLTTVKYDADGNQLWVKRFSGPGNANDWASAMVLDEAGNVYVTGASGGDSVTIKYDANGNELWVGRHASGTAIGIALDGGGNVYVSGGATIKYDPDGNQLWAAPSPASTRALVVDGAGNVYITGEIWGAWYDYLTIKYDTFGNVLWSASESSIGQNHDYPTALALDGNGGVVVTGQWDSFINWNYENHDFYTISYSGAGVRQWTALYSGPGGANDPTMDKPWDITVDDAGDIYVTGCVDQNWFSEGTFLDYATVKYAPDGTLVWAMQYAGPGVTPYDYDIPRALALDVQGNVYVTGYSCGAGTKDDVATIKYTQLAPTSVPDQGPTHPVEGVVAGFVLLGVEPNPTFGAVGIRYHADNDAMGELAVLDIAGRLVRTEAVVVTKGDGRLRWDGRDADGTKAAAGTYILRVRMGDTEHSSRATVLQ